MHPPLPRSLRKYIQRRKTELRKRHGRQSPQLEEFLAWVRVKKSEKEEKVKIGQED